MQLEPPKVTKIVLAATSLHNWLRSESTNDDNMFTPCVPCAGDSGQGFTYNRTTTSIAIDTWFPFLPHGSNHSFNAKHIREEF